MTESSMPDPVPSPSTARRLWREAVELVQVVVVALVLATSFQTVAFQTFTIPSSSMEPGLVTGDYLVVSKFRYGWSRASLPVILPLPSGRVFGRSPRRGDVIVFRLPRDPEQVWVKRLIGLPGDRIQVQGGVVFVNQLALPQSVIGRTFDHDNPQRPVRLVRETGPDGRSHILYDGGSGQAGDDTGIYVIPPGFYFMMGDNRDNSLDSRWPQEVGVGLLPATNVIGRAEMIVASWQPGASLLKPWTWVRMQSDRFFQSIV